MSKYIVKFDETKISDLRYIGSESIDDLNFITDFEIENMPVPLVNTLRRSFSTLCPTVTFDNTYFNNTEFNSIKIINNTSSLHNEFISHRLSLIPINMDNKYFKGLVSTVCNENGERVWKFSDLNMVPEFMISIKNSADQQDSRDTSGIIDVTTSNFNITIPMDEGKDDESVVNESKNIDPKTFFLPDFYTSENILINKLKSNMANKLEGEEMNIICKPRIGLGKKNARNDPTGTVKYSFKVDEDKVNDILIEKIKYVQNERIQKGLSEYTPEEISQITNSFNLLDKDRVYEKNSLGEPSSFNLSIESIGFMSSSQIIYDSVINLKLTLIDIRNSFILSETNTNLSLNLKNKVKVDNLERDNINNGCSIKIVDENHTIGNLLQYYLRKNFLQITESDPKILKIAGYRMDHPTIEEIEFIMVPLSTLKKSDIITNIKHILSKNSDFSNIDYGLLKSEYDDKLIHYLCILAFIVTINDTLKDINKFISEFENISGIKDTLYNIEDSESYFTENIF